MTARVSREFGYHTQIHKNEPPDIYSAAGLSREMQPSRVAAGGGVTRPAITSQNGPSRVIRPFYQIPAEEPARLRSVACELGELGADGRGVGVAGAQDAGAVGDHLAVQLLGFG